MQLVPVSHAKVCMTCNCVGVRVRLWCVCPALQAGQEAQNQAGRQAGWQGWQAAIFRCQETWAGVCPGSPGRWSDTQRPVMFML